jgi:penicillin-binding protein 1A
LSPNAVVVRPIRSQADYELALRDIAELMNAAVGSPEADRLDVLATLVEAYEAKQHPRAPADPIKVLQLAMRAQGKGQKELADVLGSRSRASEVLSRKRRLSADMIERIERSLAIPAQLLSVPYDLVTGGLRRALVRGAAASAIVLGMSLVGIGGMFWSYGRDLPDAAQLAQYHPQTVTRMDADGRIVEQRRFVPLADIPPHVVKAFLAAEDQHFYDHAGTSSRGILRAMGQNLIGLGTDRAPWGAATITQQVAKNLPLAGEPRSFARKVKEIILARRIESALSKDAILEIYLNQIYFGGSAFGVAVAAEGYFGKPLDALNVSEAAYLAALPKAPNNYRLDRADNRGRAKARRDWVLTRMAEDGLITATAAHLAREEPLLRPN